MTHDMLKSTKLLYKISIMKIKTCTDYWYLVQVLLFDDHYKYSTWTLLYLYNNKRKNDTCIVMKNF